MAKLEYVIPFLQPHITVQLPGTPAHAPVRSGQGEGKRRIASMYVYIKLPALLTNNTAKDVPQQGDLSRGPLPPGCLAPLRRVGSQSWKQITGHVIFLFLPLRRLFTAPHSHSKHVERIFPRHIFLSELSS